MYEYIEGIISIKNMSYITIDINGLGYKVYVSIKTYENLAQIGEKDRLYIHTVVKEDDISFFGFKTTLEREIFNHCIAINGIGAKKAISILSLFSYEELVAIIKTKNSKELAKVPGIGVKKAEKIIIDLSDKIDNIDVPLNINNQDIIELMNKKENLKLALESLGYEKVNINNLIDEETIKKLSMQELIKLSLVNINKKH